MQPIAMHPHLVLAVRDRGHLDGIDIPPQDARTALVAAAEAPPVTFATLLGFRETTARGYVERIAAAVWADRRTILGTEDVKAPDTEAEPEAKPEPELAAETAILTGTGTRLIDLEIVTSAGTRLSGDAAWEWISSACTRSKPKPEPEATTEPEPAAEADPEAVPRPGCRCALCLATPEQRRRLTEDMAAQLTRAIRRNPLLFPPPPAAPRTLFPFDLT